MKNFPRFTVLYVLRSTGLAIGSHPGFQSEEAARSWANASEQDWLRKEHDLVVEDRLILWAEGTTN